MKLKYLVISSSLLIINALQSAELTQQPQPIELPPAYTTTVIAAQPAPQIITSERTVMVCPECNCSTEGVLRVCTCLATPVILPVALVTGAVYGTVCGCPELCAASAKEAQNKNDPAAFCCACFCCPCACVLGTVIGAAAGAIKYPTKVIQFIAHGNQGS